MSIDKLQPKSSAQSRVEMTEMILPNDANVLGNVLGGRVMHWIDMAAATAAHRHCNSICVTASLEEMSFLNPIKVGQLAYLIGTVVCTGNTSLVTKVEVFSEDMDTGEKKKTSEAYLTFVNLGRDGKPQPVPPLKIETDEDRSECEKARAIRKKHMKVKKQENR
jgi:acyl-CoA hydrolase